ncbi:MAG: endonuclease domain-containing protein [candidate division Zixibacteria bacterium]|nr:endonuclease domain-containing protein [candidate division Zixibacteria bacterium]
MTQIYNKASEKEKRRLLRKNMPKAEVIMWSKLKQKQLLGYRFRRQYSVGSYVIDFFCPELKLAVEVDGTSHFKDGAEYYDRNRQESIEQLGIKFLRFNNAQVYKNLNGVLEVIVDNVQKIRSFPLNPLLTKEGSKGRLIPP